MSHKASVRESFVRWFGEDQARAIERAAHGHKNGIHDEAGSDLFRWAALICIGSQCVEVERYRLYHKITIPFSEFKRWLFEEGRVSEHDGQVDYISLFAGVYNEFIPSAKRDKTDVY